MEVEWSWITQFCLQVLERDPQVDHPTIRIFVTERWDPVHRMMVSAHEPFDDGISGGVESKA